MDLAQRIVALGLLVALSACATAETSAPPTSPNVPVATDKAPADTAYVAPLQQPEPEINAPVPDALIGLVPADLSKEIGNASLVRRDLGAEIWQYRTDNCVLFFFLYSQSDAAQPETLRVHHIDVRGDQDATSCLKNIVKKRSARRQG